MIMIIDRQLVNSKLPKRPYDAHKGTMGSLYIICGSYGMAGACILSAKSALRSGVGLVRIATVQRLYPILAISIPEAVFDILPDEEFFTLNSLQSLADGANNSAACLIGCGIGTNEPTQQLVLELLPKIKVPLLIDADGINAISKHIFILSQLKSCQVVLTPHPKEMSRLTDLAVPCIQSDRILSARNFAIKNNVTLLLKGNNTIIADKSGCIYQNTTGNSGLATGGSGDVLSGIISSIMAQGVGATDSAICGAYILGLVADILAERTSKSFLLPSDIIDNLYIWEKI